MLYVFSLILVSVATLDSTTSSPTEKHLSPPMVGKSNSWKVEIPELLDDSDAVEDPAGLLKSISDRQQIAWEKLKTCKVQAWYRFYNHRGKKPVTWLLNYAHSKQPGRFKELKLNSNRMMQEAKLGRKYDPVGVAADEEDAWYCLNASIATPEMVAIAMFTKYMRPDNMEMLTLFPSDKERSAGILQKYTRRFGFATSPKDFYGVALPRIAKAGGEIVVRKKGDLVELDFTDPEDHRTPRKIYRFDLSKDGVAVMMYHRGQSAEIEVQKIDGHWVPMTRKEQNLTRYVETDFFDWKLNTDLTEEFSLKTLPMADKTIVNDKRVTPAARTFFRDWED